MNRRGRASGRTVNAQNNVIRHPCKDGLHNRVRFSERLYWNTFVEELCRWGAIIQERDKNLLSNDWSGCDKCCFRKTGDAIRSNCRVAGCGQMMTCNTEGAVVIVGRVHMVVRQRHESGKDEKEYEKYGKLTALVHVPTMHGSRLIYAVVFVKKLFKTHIGLARTGC